jgi:hypothetical protein
LLIFLIVVGCTQSANMIVCYFPSKLVESNTYIDSRLIINFASGIGDIFTLAYLLKESHNI